MKIEDIFSDSESYYDCDEENKQNILKHILQTANDEKSNFISRVKQINPTGNPANEEFSPLQVVYEALAKDLNNWGNFFVEELKRILEIAKSSPRPRKVLDVLTEYVYVNKSA